MKKTLAYMIVLDSDIIILPPLGDNSDCDFVVFTNVTTLQARHWEVRFDESICAHREAVIKSPEAYISGYDKYIFVAENQVVCGSLCKDSDNLVTVPAVESFLPPEIALVEPIFEETPLNPTYTDGAYNGYPLQLSICLPISNRKDTLAKCLEGLKPLLTQLKAELIVVDSSDDGSREIAEAYGGKIIPYTWRNNFAHARNTAIQAAKGAWILSLDDDEWFDGVDEIIKFFKGSQWKTCDMASYIVRSYLDDEGKSYSDIYAERMAKNHPSLHYKNAVHECFDFSFMDKRLGSKFFSDYAHHFGYVYKTDEQRENKLFRNIAGLYTALKEAPLDLRLWLQMVTEVTALKKYDLATALCFKLLALCELQLDNPKINAMHWRSVTFIYLYTAAQLVDDDGLFQRIFDLTVFNTLNCFQHACTNYFIISRYFNKGRYEELCTYAEEYYSLRKEYLAAPSKPTLSQSVQTDLVEPTNRYNTVLILHSFALMKLEAWEKCGSMLSKVSFDAVGDNDQRLLAPILYKLPEKTFRKIFPKVNDNIIELLYKHAKQLYDNSLQSKGGIISLEVGDFEELAAKVTAANCFMDNPYIRMIQLYGNPASLNTYDWFCQEQSRMEGALEDICLPAAVNGYALHNFTSKLKLEGIQQMIRALSTATKEEFIQIFEDSLQARVAQGDFDGLSSEELYLFTGFLEAHLLKVTDLEFEAMQNRYLEFFTCYIMLLNKWTAINYNSSMLEGENFYMLPATSRGAVYMIKALAVSASKEARIEAVKRAVAECALFDRGAKLLLSDIVESTSATMDASLSATNVNNAVSSPKTEFELLGEQLKGTAKQLLATGKLAEAQNILLQLSQLLPADLEVKELLSRCKTSNLPN